MKQYEVLNWASLFLKKNNCEEQIAAILLQHHLSVEKSEFYMMMQETVPSSIIEKFKRDINAHVDTGIPVQHLIGYEMFYGREFLVNRDVLIPRPETEELVQQVIKEVNNYPQGQPLTIVDIGTGSGVIAITLALEIPHAKIYATDISKKALKVAEKNAKQLGADINFLHGNYLQPVINNGISIDIIVSNPPYISKLDEPDLSKTVKDFDPNIALFAERNGLQAYQEILELSTKVVKQPHSLFFEIGYKQGLAVQTIIKETYPQINIDIIQDINGKDRIVAAKFS